MKINLRKYQSLFLAIIFISITITYFILGAGTRMSDKQAAAQMEQMLKSDRKVLLEILPDLQEVLLTNGEKALFHKSLEYEEKYKSRFAFALYKSAELKVWSDNHVAFPDNLSLVKTDGLQQMGSVKVLLVTHKFIHFTLVGAQIIGTQYPWENEFLKSSVAPYFAFDNQVQITSGEGSTVFDEAGKTLFFVKSVSENGNSGSQYWPFFLLILALFFLSILLKNGLNQLKSRYFVEKMLIFSGILAGWYFLHFLFQVPTQLFQSQLFSPLLYALYNHHINLGNLVIWSWILLLITIYYVKNKPQKSAKLLSAVLYVIILFTGYYAIVFLIRSFVFDSQIVLNLYELATLNLNSFLVLGVVFILLLCWLLLAYQWLGQLKSLSHSNHVFWGFSAVSFFAPFLFLQANQLVNWIVILSFNGVIILIYFVQRSNKNQRLLWEALAYLTIVSLSISLYINNLNDVREKQNRETAALKLNLINDPFLEEHFISSISKIQKDEDLLKFVSAENAELTDDSIVQHITTKYFEPFLQQYNINLIHCNERSVITVLPDNYETSCYGYFNQRADSAKVTIRKDTLYLLQSSFQYHNYIGRICLGNNSAKSSCIFIEFVSRLKPKEKGLPALLEKSAGTLTYLKRNYSWASYNKGLLAERFGKFDYKQKYNNYNFPNSTKVFVEYNNFNHYLFSIGQGNVFIISLENPNILQKLASIAFILLYFSLLAFVFYALFSFDSLKISVSSFQARLQYSMILLLLFSFFLIGISSLYYIRYLNQSKNADNLMEKAHSVLIELEHKLSHIKQFSNDDLQNVEGLLFKFSEVFFTDITLYNYQGAVLASSRPEIFKSGLVSERMDARAYYELNGLKNSFFLQEETIGSQKYLSAYLPFQSDDNKALAYLNLPYFTKQYELESEFSGFIVTFLNIYIFLLIIAITITVVISRYLSKPLKMLKEKIQLLNLQNQNEKIEWDKVDEIGDLIKEYNRMVDELSRSAQELALNQRESAWREMAQQIAHEIKNPLTPMKLNVQYLVKAWDDKVDDFEGRMKRIAKGLEEQIDVLTQISGQFSTFAAIDRIQPEILSLHSIIGDVEAIFHNQGTITFIQDFPQNEILVRADKSQLIRVFNNLYKNAVQAIATGVRGEIISKIALNNSQVEISITDNGCGIDDEELQRIFEPRFTTKTGGMGLGLALVKKMLENADGKISVHSEKDAGSTFTITLPIAD